MPSQIAWLPEAVKDIVCLRGFILKKNPNAATRAVSRIKKAVNILEDNPEAGKPVEDLLPYRDLFIPYGNGNFIVRYREEISRVLIVRVRHSKEESF